MEIKLYTLAECAEILKVSMRTMHNFVSSGKLKSTKIGSSRRISEEDLREFIENGRG